MDEVVPSVDGVAARAAFEGAVKNGLRADDCASRCLACHDVQRREREGKESEGKGREEEL